MDTNKTKIYYNTLFKNFFKKFILTSRLEERNFLILGIKKKIWIFKIRNLKKNNTFII